jgi:hypothetical protein
MSGSSGYDYSSWRPSSAKELSDVQFVCRYLSNEGNSKNLTLQEAQELTSWGKFIVCVWETSGKGGNKAQGAADAIAAVAMAVACGWPAGRPIYFAIDEDVDPATQDDYFDGLATVLPKSVIGAYGEAALIERWRSFGAGWGFLAESTGWEGGDNISGCQIQQTGTDPSNNYDYDIALVSDYGGWQVGGKTTAPVSTPVVTTAGDSSNEDDPMAIQAKSDSTGLVLLQWPQGSNPAAVHVLQFYYDGAFGNAPALRVDLGLTTGPWVIEENDWTGQRFVYEIPDQFRQTAFAVSVKATSNTGTPFSVMAS